MIATLLSAQCTDARVNKVTPLLFSLADNPEKMFHLGEVQIRKIISSVNFFNNKARNIHKLSKILIDSYQGRVPKKLEELVTLPGIGRKTANVVLGNAFSIPSMVVDTHVGRTSLRLGWTKSFDPVVIEKDLQKLFDPSEWVDLSHRLILLGRQYCTARKAKCGECPVVSLCPTGKKLNYE